MYTDFVEKELKKCLLCKNPLCHACPAETQIPKVISLARDGKTMEAGALLFDNNPLTAITGAVCPNHLYCHGACVLSKVNKAVNFGKIECEISRQYIENPKLKIPTAKNKNAKKFLIIGSGPSGLALSYYLRKDGHNVTVYEREQHFGGMLRYGIPDFRLDKTLIDKIVTALESIGIKFKNNTTADLNNLEQYKSDFDAIVLAIGAGISKTLDIPGSSLATPALEYLKSPKQAQSVIVIGAGNVAIDCTLTAAHNHAKSVNLCYRRDEAAMKAYPDELALARSQGVRFNYFMVPKKITQTKTQKFRVEFERHDKKVTKTADLVVLAIGQIATPDGLVKATDFQTESPNIYALGDAVTGPGTIIKAVASAKQLFSQIIKQD